ncbi:9168_t:CDS:2, partial [Rhizophagus irregularis]
HYIRKRLPKGYRQLGKQTVSIPTTESSLNQILANILEMEGWETKFYDQRQYTYVVLCDDDNNIEDKDKNPITAVLTYETIKKLRKPKCVHGQLVVE